MTASLKQLLHELSFVVRPSPRTNDHELRILVDGNDILGVRDGTMGLDPPDFHGQKALLNGGGAILGRCGCGVVSCDDFDIEVSIDQNEVGWSGDNLQLLFPLEDYRRTLIEAARDHGWEDGRRRAERLVSDVLAGTELDSGFVFEWASGRIEQRTIVLSFCREPYEQRMTNLSWDGENPATAVAAAKAFLRERHA